MLVHGEWRLQGAQENSMTYAVHLVDFPDLPADARSKAEERFRRALDKALGEGAGRALKAFENASDSSADQLNKEEFALAIAWADAYTAAKTAGFRDLGEANGAFFEVRLSSE
jgi:hypothetical protein